MLLSVHMHIFKNRSPCVVQARIEISTLLPCPECKDDARVPMVPNLSLVLKNGISAMAFLVCLFIKSATSNDDKLPL